MPIRNFYRYRSIEKLLGPTYQELERQEVYFAAPEQLNDPMEGYQDVFWSGDDVLWNNLIRHYALCLSQAVSIVQIMGEKFNTSMLDCILSWSASNLPTKILKDNHKSICDGIFAEPGLRDCIKQLARVRKKVHRAELTFYLSAFHGIIIYHVIRRFNERGLLKWINSPEFPRDGATQTWKHVSSILCAFEDDSTTPENVLSVMFELGNRMSQQMSLISLFNRHANSSRGWSFLLFEFADFYCNNISATLYPRWYAACFVANPVHAAMWAHYGDRHTGVCLKFRAQVDEAERPYITLTGASGHSFSPEGKRVLIGRRRLDLTKINYTNCFPEIDFFRSLGRLQVFALDADWYTDDGIHSDIGRDVLGGDRNWHRNYWENLQKIITTKFNDWKYEDEYRMIINCLLEDELPAEQRVYKYDFADLEGIIFGINTSLDDKMAIMQAVEKKCDKVGRKEFEFFQAVYSSGTTKMDVVHLNLLNFQ